MGMCKCGGGMCLCPVSFGLALGITSLLAGVLWALWGLYQGADMEVMGVLLRLLIIFAKGFLFGFVLIWIYDVIVTRCKGICCRKDKEVND